MEICKIIETGSSGNAVLLHGCILVDIGVPFSKIQPYIKSIQIVLIGHIHSDHLNLKTLKRLQFERPSVRIAVGIHMLEILSEFKNIDIIKLGEIYNYGFFKLEGVKLYHDVTCFGWRIFKGEHKTFFATDTAHLEGIEAKNYDLYAIEHNYNEDTIFESIAKIEAEGGFAHQKGAINSHLSEQQAGILYLKMQAKTIKL
jgi:L-ascorbate metabolism protein UlaG (beta-lactamase superfamily)